MLRWVHDRRRRWGDDVVRALGMLDFRDTMMYALLCFRRKDG